MEEELMLKQKYNDLLQSLRKGEEYIKSNPEDEKAQKRLTELANEMQNIMNAIPNMTQEEMENGFKIENKPKETQVVVDNVALKPQVQQKNIDSGIISTTTGDIELTPQIVRKYLVNGQSNVTDQEVMMFIGMCKANKLNPFNKEAYLIKYGNQPASIITSKDVFFKRAIQNPSFNGLKSGIIVLNDKDEIVKREGHIYTSKEKIIGAWCEVFRKDWEHSMYQEVNMSEYIGKTKTGEINSNWKTKPAVMITKVAEATALRKAFTENLQEMYIAEENEEMPIQRENPTDIL